MLPLSKWENQDKSHSRGRELLSLFQDPLELLKLRVLRLSRHNSLSD